MSDADDAREYRPEASYRRLTSDLEFREVNPVPRFAKDVPGAVSFIPVTRTTDTDVEILSYLWFSDAEGGAGYVPRARMAPDAFNVGVVWSRRLREAKAADLLPSVAVLGFGELDPDPVFGQAKVDEVATIESLRALKELAQK